jgi:hypothetical protein
MTVMHACMRVMPYMSKLYHVFCICLCVCMRACICKLYMRWIPINKSGCEHPRRALALSRPDASAAAMRQRLCIDCQGQMHQTVTIATDMSHMPKVALAGQAPSTTLDAHASCIASSDESSVTPDLQPLKHKHLTFHGVRNRQCGCRTDCSRRRPGPWTMPWRAPEACP